MLINERNVLHSCVYLTVRLWAFSERVMPYFAQEPLSYLTLPTIKNAYKAFSIKINFRPDNVDGKEVQPQISFTVKLYSILFYTFFLLNLATW